MSTLTVRSLTKPEIDSMDSKTYDWHYKFNRANLDAALTPPPSPPPPTAEQAVAQERAAKVKELLPQFEAWLKTQKHDHPGSLTWDLFRRDHAMRIFLEEHNQRKDIEAGVQRFLSAHPEYVQVESNRVEMNQWLGKNKLPVTFENLEKAFAAVKKDLILDKSKIDPVETRSGAWRNARFYPNDEDNSGGTTRQFNMGQSTPGASNQDVEIDKRPEQMNSTEFAEACRVSKTFRAKMDG
jgi:hypothetical protein